MRVAAPRSIVGPCRRTGRHCLGRGPLPPRSTTKEVPEVPVFALFPLPPTEHQRQLRRLRDEYGQDELDARQRRLAGQATAPSARRPLTGPVAGLSRAVGVALIWAGERLWGGASVGRAVVGHAAAGDPGVASR